MSKPHCGRSIKNGRYYCGHLWKNKNIYFETTFTPFVKTLKIYFFMTSHLTISNPYVNKGPFSQSYGFSINHVWMWELDYKESWVLKNWCFWTVVLEETLTVQGTARRSNQSILKEISPEYSLEGLMLKLKLQYFGHLMQSTDSFEKILMLGKIGVGGEGDNRGWYGWMASPTQWTWFWANSQSWCLVQAWNATVHGVTKSQTRLSDWTELKTLQVGST